MHNFKIDCWFYNNKICLLTVNIIKGVFSVAALAGLKCSLHSVYTTQFDFIIKSHSHRQNMAQSFFYKILWRVVTFPAGKERSQTLFCCLWRPRLVFWNIFCPSTWYTQIFPRFLVQDIAPLYISIVCSWQCICCTLRSWVHPILMLFRTFSPRLEDIDTFQCSSDSFLHWPHISGCVQNCQNYISMYHCSQIAGRRS